MCTSVSIANLHKFSGLCSNRCWQNKYCNDCSSSWGIPWQNLESCTKVYKLLNFTSLIYFSWTFCLSLNLWLSILDIGLAHFLLQVKQHFRDGILHKNEFKIVYVAPMKVFFSPTFSVIVGCYDDHYILQNCVIGIGRRGNINIRSPIIAIEPGC